MNRKSIISWITNTKSEVQEHGLQGLDSFWRQPYYKFLHQVDKVQNPGVSIYDLDWDLMIILDACRFDLFYEVADEYDFLPNDIEVLRSLDSMTPAWMERTFIKQQARSMADTYYLCANPFSEQKLDGRDFAELDEIWKYGWNGEHDTVTPEAVTNRCINIGREYETDRLLVHYMQPHWPFVPAMALTNDGGMRLDEFGTYNRDEVWERLRRGEVSSEEVWEGYRDNLRYALDSVAVLLQNIDAENVIITSDHGNAFGEYGVYGHPMHMPLSCLRSVPYVELSATDQWGREPNQFDVSVGESDIEAQLEALGYQ